MVEQFVNELTVRLSNYFSFGDLSIIRREVCLAVKDYEISKKSTELSIWHGQLPDCYRAFMVTKHLEGLSENTLSLYKNYLEDMFFTIHKPVETISTNDLRVYLYLVQKNRGVSNRTLDSRRSVLSSFFSWSASEGYLSYNPMITIKPIKYERRERVPLTDMQLENIRYQCLDVRTRAMVEFMYSTGCRVSELCSVDLKDVNMTSGEVVLFGKGNKHRKSYLSARALFYLNEYLDTREDNSPALFVGKRSPHDRLSKAAVEKVVRDIGEQAGIENLHPHLFRHTVATNCLNRGMDVTQLQEMLGHSSIETTMIYAKVNKKELQHSHRKYIE